ncbi:MAG: hypothetical protein MJY86_08510 [Bacteroidales bacterium]|nr:hypothetical protein [Bacteroidales bacterium]
MKRMIIAAILSLAAICSHAQYNCQIAVFGSITDGVTDNTATIQKAVDMVSANGGGTLSFAVGRYLTGAIELKDNVTIELKEGAVLVASPNIHSFGGHKALIWSDGAENVAVIGRGSIDGNGAALGAAVKDQYSKGYIESAGIPALVDLSGCTGARVEGIKLINPAGEGILGVKPEGVYVYDYAAGKCITPSGKTIKIQK